MRRITDRGKFVAAYPAPSRAPCPWDQTRSISFVAEHDDDWARRRLQTARRNIQDLYGIDAPDRSSDGDPAADAVAVFGSHRIVVRSRGDGVSSADELVLTEGDADNQTALIGALSVAVQGFAQRMRARVAPSRAGTALVVAASGIGDLIRTTPLIRVLSRLGHRVDFLIAADYPDCADLFRGARRSTASSSFRR